MAGLGERLGGNDGNDEEAVAPEHASPQQGAKDVNEEDPVLDDEDADHDALRAGTSAVIWKPGPASVSNCKRPPGSFGAIVHGAARGPSRTSSKFVLNPSDVFAHCSWSGRDEKHLLNPSTARD